MDASPEPIRSARLTLEPLRVDHAEAMAGVLGDPELYRYIGGIPPSVDALAARYRRQINGPRTDQMRWFNWIMVNHETGNTPVGFVQATLERGTDRYWSAHLAWVVGINYQGHRFASEASAAVVAWLSEHGIVRFDAHIGKENVASIRTAAALGMVWNGGLDSDGEQVWVRSAP